MEGNQMRMREALERIAAIPMPPPKEQAQSVAVEMRELAIAALSAPPRNCDRDLSDRNAIFAEFRQWVHASSLGCVSEPSASDAFRWLLAPATGWKGEGDGK